MVESTVLLECLKTEVTIRLSPKYRAKIRPQALVWVHPFGVITVGEGVIWYHSSTVALEVTKTSCATVLLWCYATVYKLTSCR